MIAKADVDFKMRIEEAPSIELRDWLYNDFLITFWESRPKFEKIKEEGSEVAIDRVVCNEKDQPITEKINRGIAKINLLDWLKKSPVGPIDYAATLKKKKQAQQVETAELSEKDDPHVFHKYVYFYSDDILKLPEFKFQNKVDTLKRKNVEALVEYL